MGVPDMSSVFWLSLAALVSVALAAPDHFDQRQSGKYNVRIQLKELKIVAVSMPTGDSEGDYDEGNYDYEDPIDTMEHSTKSTTSKPTTAPAANISTSSQNATSESFSSASPDSLLSPSNVDSLTAISTSNSSEITSITDLLSTTSTNTPLETTSTSNSSPIVDDVTKADGVEESNTTVTADPEVTTELEASTPVVSTTIDEVTTKRINQKFDPTKRIRSRVRCRPGFSKDRAGRCRKTRIPVKPLADVISR